MLTLFSTFPISLLEYRIFVSSANKTNLSLSDTFTISFMYKLNKLDQKYMISESRPHATYAIKFQFFQDNVMIYRVERFSEMIKNTHSE